MKILTEQQVKTLLEHSVINRSALARMIYPDKSAENAESALWQRTMKPGRPISEKTRKLITNALTESGLTDVFRDAGRSDGKVLLMNSAMMPSDGVYRKSNISKDQFFGRVREAYEAGQLVNHIGYEQNLSIIRQATGVDLDLNFDMTYCEPGDVLLCMTLPYRVGGWKGVEVDEGDFEYSEVLVL